MNTVSPQRIRSPQTIDYRLWERHGLLGWWLDLTAPPPPPKTALISERERLRKAELTSVSLLAVFACLLALVSNSLADLATAEAVVAIALSLLVAAVLNRTGRTRVAAYFVPSVLLLIMAAHVVQEPLGLIGLPVYDLFAIPVFLVSLLGDRRATWVFGGVAMAFVIWSYESVPHEVLPLSGGAPFDGIGYQEHIFGIWGMVNRHLILIFFAALLGWIGARSVDKAILRADRSDEMAAFLEQARRQEAEQARRLHDLLQEMMDAFVAQANGETRYLADRPPTDPFSNQVLIVNERLRREERLRRQSGVWSQGQVAQAVAALVQRLDHVLRSWLPLRALAPENVRTNIEVVDKLSGKFWEVLCRVGESGNAQSRPASHYP
jgi:hypothetical protein